MAISDRIARLEQRVAPAKASTADRLAEVLRAGRERSYAMTPEDREAERRASHEAALSATPPGPGASELSRRLYDAAMRVARDYISRSFAGG